MRWWESGPMREIDHRRQTNLTGIGFSPGIVLPLEIGLPPPEVPVAVGGGDGSEGSTPLPKQHK